METWQVYTYLATTLFNVAIVFAALSIQLGRPVKRIHVVIYAISYFVLVSYSVIVVQQPIVTVCANLITLFAMTTCYEGNLINKIVALGLTYGLFFIIEAFGIILSSFLKTSLLIRHSIIKIIALAALQLISRLKYIKEGNKYLSKTYIAFFIAVPAASIAIILLNAYDLESRMLQNFITVIIIGSLDVFVYYIYNSISNFYIELNKSQAEARENRFYMQQMGEIEKNLVHIRTIIHDMKNYLLPILDNLDNGNYSKAKHLLLNVLDEKLKINKYVDTGNMVIDNVMNYKLSLIEEYKPELKIDIQIPNDMGFEDFDLCLILGNMLDNVSDAFSHIQNANNKILSVKMKFEKSVLSIHVHNSFNGTIKHDKNGDIITIKADDGSHGLGLSSIDATTKKYSGFMKTDIDSSIFNIDVMLFESY